MASVSKIFQYRTIIIADRGHITDPKFLAALNAEGRSGWRHKEEQPVGASRLAILLEREVALDEVRKICDDSEVGEVEDETDAAQR